MTKPASQNAVVDLFESANPPVHSGMVPSGFAFLSAPIGVWLEFGKFGLARAVPLNPKANKTVDSNKIRSSLIKDFIVRLSFQIITYPNQRCGYLPTARLRAAEPKERLLILSSSRFAGPNSIFKLSIL